MSADSPGRLDVANGDFAEWTSLNPDYAEIIVSTRGQQINNRPPYANPYGDYFISGFDSEYNYYYRGAYMDCVRAIDFLCSRPKIQQLNIFAEGGSQGAFVAFGKAD